MRHPNAQHNCPLFNKIILWGDCWVVQDIRDDNTDMEFALEPFSIKDANVVCEQCKWYQAPTE